MNILDNSLLYIGVSLAAIGIFWSLLRLFIAERQQKKHQKEIEDKINRPPL